MKKRYALIIPLILLFSSAYSQIDNIHRELIELTLKNNRDLLERKIELKIQNSKVKESYASYLPNIQSNIDIRNQLKMPVMIIPGEVFGTEGDMETSMGAQHNLDATISLNQSLFNLNNYYNIKEAKSTEDLYKLLTIQTKEDIIYQVSLLYYYLLASYNNKNVLTENLTTLNSNKEITRRLVNSQIALCTDSLRIDIRINDIKNQINELNASINEQKRNIQLLVGIDSLSLFEQELPTPNNNDKNLNNVPLYKRVIGLNILENQKKINSINIAKAKSSFYPKVSFYSNYSFVAQRDKFNYFDSGENWNKVSSIGVNISIPIFSGGDKFTKLNQAKFNYQLVENQIYKTELSSKNQYNTAIDKFYSNIKNNEIQLKNSLITKKIFEHAKLKYKEGILSLTDLLIADSDYHNSKLQHNITRLNIYIAKLEVLKSAGEIESIVR
jgi:outer membrane protein TolC